MFSMDIASPGNQQMIFRGNQSPAQQSAVAAAAAAAAAQQQQQPQHHQIFPSQYGYHQQQQTPQHIQQAQQQQQQQQQPSPAQYYTAYSNSSSGASAKAHMNFVAPSASAYMQPPPQQQQQQQPLPPPPQQQQPQQQQQQQPTPPQQQQQQQNMFPYGYAHQTTQMGLPYVQNAMRYPAGGHHSPNNSSSTSNNANSNNNNNNNNSSSMSHSHSSISRHNNISVNSNNNSVANTPIYGGGGGGGGMRYGGGRGRGGGYMPHGFSHFHRQVHNNYYYNQQHHFSSNNAVPEKTPTLRIVHPNTKKILNIKLNRIYNTMADLRPQLQRLHQGMGGGSGGAATTATGAGAASGEKLPTLLLCLDFLSLRGCMHGSGCDRVHVAGLEYMWDTIEPTTTRLDDGTTAYEAGFRVHCYDPTLTRYYNIPSECVKVSKGSQEYIVMFNDHGDNFKTKFKLCADMTNAGTCDKGEDCTDIHCSLKDFESVRESNTNATHLNDAALMSSVPRLPAEMVVRVFDQNSLDTFHDYMGNNVLITEGAKTYAKYYEQEMNNIPSRKRMQHCAHFRLKDLCRLGETCRFLHVLPTPEEVAQRKEADAAKALREEQQRQQQQQQQQAQQAQQRHVSIGGDSGSGSGSSNSSSSHNPYA